MKNSTVFSILSLTTIITLFHSSLSLGQNQQKTFQTQIEISKGTIESVDEDGITVFRGFPFAAPPVGDKRWTAPVDHESWNGVLETKEFGSASIQFLVFGD